MQSTSVSSSHSSYWYPIPNHFLHFHHLSKKPISLSFRKNQTRTNHLCVLTLSTTQNCSKERDNDQQNNSYLDQTSKFPSDPFCASSDSSYLSNPNTEIQIQEGEGEGEGERQHQESEVENCELLSTNMWWAELKAAVGQRINVEGIVSSTMVIFRDRQLALPHVYVPDIRYVDWAELQGRGFKGVVFDKDNTITVPYSLTLWGPLSSSIERCKTVFGHDIAILSNSAGLYEYDHNGSRARSLEGTIGIKVIRHRVKKPAGTAEEIEKHFGCKSSQLIMVGDRPFTDIVYGNRNGFLTILTEPLSLTEEPFIVRQVRKLEVALVKRWFRKGLKPESHDLLPDAMQCVRNPPPP